MSATRHVIVFGAGGQLGRQIPARLQQSTAWSVTPLTHQQVDITDAAGVRKVILDHRPTWVVNAAASTQVDRCETERALAEAVNADAVGVLADACNEIGATLLHMSTDYVFDGRSSRSYREDDPPGALSAYAVSKLHGEERAGGSREHLIVRTAWLFGPGGRNFVDTILNKASRGDSLRVVNDQKGSPSYAPDMAECIERLMAIEARGVYHLANSGEATWHELACKAVELAGHKTPVAPIPTEAYPTPAKRPAYSVLDCSKYVEATGHQPRPWPAALADHIRLRGESAVTGDKTQSTCVVLVTDLIFMSKIRSTAEALGVRPIMVRSIDEFRAACGQHRPPLIIIDLDAQVDSAVAAVSAAKEIASGRRVLAYCSHVRADLMESARAAGADDVWPRSRFSAELPALFKGL